MTTFTPPRGPQRRSGVERRVVDLVPAVFGKRDRRSGRERRSGKDRRSGGIITRSSGNARALEDHDRFDALIDAVRKAAADDLSLPVDRGMAPLSIAWGGRDGEVYSIVNDLDAFRTLPTSAMVERVMARIRAWKEDLDR